MLQALLFKNFISVQPESLLSCYKEIWTKTRLADPQVSTEKKNCTKGKRKENGNKKLMAFV